ncbi:MAG TPA: TetR/AcrR family transcriptional regulator [Solirubrobacteraceae bacterium]|jgi:AcrR family transcriptional regulator|nr:TetR/AcrR family transcriptional regulator [Solirubrobacteraceae bacterium]
MSTRTPKPRLRGHQRRDLILEAALGEFAQRGYESASMGQIAAAAGVSRTVLYDHFPAKHVLFVEVLSSQHDVLLTHLSERIASEGPMRERIRGTFDAFFAFAEQRPLAFSLLFPDNPPVDPAVAAEYRRRRVESNRLLSGLLVADARRAGIDTDSPVGRAVFVMYQEALEGAARWWHSHPEVSRQELVEAAMTALWTGLGAAER